MSADWKTESVGNVATLQRGFDLPSRLRKPGSVPIITSSGVEYGHHEAKVKGPGVVTGRYGTIGEVFFVQGDFWPLNTTLYVRDFHGNSPRFVSYLLRTIDFKTHSGKSGVPGVNRNDLHEIVVTLPLSLAEQEAIAEALSDADALIESLEQLLTKKHQTKKGVMQGLLTGKKRLPGFGGEWEVKRLGEVSEIVMGQSPSSAHYNNKGEGLPLIQGNADISGRQTIRRVFTTEITKQGHAGDILMSVRAPVGKISRTVFDVCLGRGVCAIRCSENDFLYYALVAREPTWAKLSKGSTFDSVSSTDVKNFQIEQPTDETEQTAIATIISDMDAEIATLEAKLSKARQLKQGMMQELLTGRIRLV